MVPSGAYRILCKTQAMAAALSAAAFPYMVFVAGASSAGILLALSITLFTSFVSVWAAVIVFLE